MNNISSADGSEARPPRQMPTTIDGLLADVIKRLGRIEKHLIDIRDNVQTEPGRPRYVIDRNILG